MTVKSHKIVNSTMHSAHIHNRFLLPKPTNGFLCNLSDNCDLVEFQKFSIRDDDTKEVFFGIDGEGGPMVGQMDIDYGVEGDDCFRAIKYTFSDDVLRTPVISTSLQLCTPR